MNIVWHYTLNLVGLYHTLFCWICSHSLLCRVRAGITEPQLTPRQGTIPRILNKFSLEWEYLSLQTVLGQIFWSFLLFSLTELQAFFYSLARLHTRKSPNFLHRITFDIERKWLSLIHWASIPNKKAASYSFGIRPMCKTVKHLWWCQIVQTTQGWASQSILQETL